MPCKRPTIRQASSTLRIDPSQIDPDTISTIKRLDHVMSHAEGDLSAFTIEVKGQQISLPPHVGRLAIQALADALQSCALQPRAQQSDAVQATASDADTPYKAADETELTTTEAANLLNVSRPHLVKLLKEGAIPHHKVGSHHRVYRRDVLTYKEARRTQADSALQALTDQAQELDMGY